MENKGLARQKEQAQAAIAGLGAGAGRFYPEVLRQHLRALRDEEAALQTQVRNRRLETKYRLEQVLKENEELKRVLDQHEKDSRASAGQVRDRIEHYRRVTQQLGIEVELLEDDQT
jgi:hypothetical protein